MYVLAPSAMAVKELTGVNRRWRQAVINNRTRTDLLLLMRSSVSHHNERPVI